MAAWHPARWTELLLALPKPWLVLWLGLMLLTAALLVLMRTRWGQSQPLRKCVVLSLLAHAIFGFFATSIKIVNDTAGAPESETVYVKLSSLPDEVAASDAKPNSATAWDLPDAQATIDPETPTLSKSEAPDDEALDRAAAELLADADSKLEAPEVEVEAPQPDVAALEAPAPDRAAPSLAAETLEAVAPEKREVAEADLPLPEIEQPGQVADESLAASRNVEESLPAPQIDPLELTPQVSDLERQTAPAEALAAREDLLKRAAGSAETEQPASAGDAENSTEPSPGSPLAPSAPLAAVEKAPRADAAPHGAMGPTLAALARDRKTHDLPQVYQQRVAPDRLEIATRNGGGPETEAAVEAALTWLAENQNDDGRWDAGRHGAGRENRVLGHDRQGAGFNADTAMSGLSILAFLGAGYTHQEGPHADTVARGLEFLKREQAADGNLAGRSTLFARMYCHGMATLALCEAYAMTGDPALEPAVRKAIGYTLAAQDRNSGGWRYQPGDSGDTSQLGWQVMALRSAELGGIPMPAATRERIVHFLDSVTSGAHGGLGRYRPGQAPTRSMTAESLFCRQLLAAERGERAAQEAADFILNERPGQGQDNLYYWYYATLALYQTQGEAWDRWNEALKARLVATQRTSGPLAGSWDTNTVWGGYGGRVYTTAMGALSLEVYYRYLPLYTQTVRRELPAAPNPR